jgi:hypothetical protein
LLDPDADEQVCIECSAGAIFINPDSRDYFARLYQVPARTTCLDADPMPRRYLVGRRRPNAGMDSVSPAMRPHPAAARDRRPPQRAPQIRRKPG